MQQKPAFYLELAARWYVFFMLNIYGWGKILGGQFYRQAQLPPRLATTTLAEVGGFDLAWLFFGYSYPYVLFIGLSQVIGAAFLLFDKTKLLGVAILLPILVNIIAVDAAFGIPRGALLSACSYLFFLCLILIYNHLRIVEAFKVLIKTANTTSVLSLKNQAFKWLIVGGLVVVFFVVERVLMNLF